MNKEEVTVPNLNDTGRWIFGGIVVAFISLSSWIYVISLNVTRLEEVSRRRDTEIQELKISQAEIRQIESQMNVAIERLNTISKRQEEHQEWIKYQTDKIRSFYENYDLKNSRRK